jgi:multiple antibiotic resistance protein
MQIVTTFMQTFLLVYAALFPVINPIGDAPVFLNLTQFCAPAQRHLLAQKISISSFLLLLASMFVGSDVLSFFGIGLPVVQIGGGIVVAALGWKLLNAPPPAPDAHRGTAAVPFAVPEAFYPLTMPLTIDPGAISVAITVGSHRPKGIGIERFLLLSSAAMVGLIGISLTIYLCYRFAERLTLLFGQDGMNVIIRLSAFILFCIGIQIFWNGWSELPRPSP